jgi:hypothetical protein
VLIAAHAIKRSWQDGMRLVIRHAGVRLQAVFRQLDVPPIAVVGVHVPLLVLTGMLALPVPPSAAP